MTKNKAAEPLQSFGLQSEPGAEDRASSGHKYEQRARQLATLNEVARSLTSTLELDPLLNNILEHAIRILDCEAGSLLLTDEKSGELIFQASVGAVAQHLIGQRLPPGAGLAGKAVETRSPVIVNDVRQSKEWFQQTDQQTGFVTEALLVVPMQVKDRVIGVIEVINKRSRAPFAHDDQELLTALASQAAIALDNARLFEAERRRREELESLRQASLHLTSNLELHSVLESILEHALKLVTGDFAHIYLYDGEHLTPGASLWGNQTQPRKVREPEKNGLIYSIAQTGKRIVLSDASKHQFFHDQPQEGALVGLPLRKGGQIQGVMSISFASPHTFDDDELRVLGLLADQAAIALENARLFEALQARLYEISALSEASAALRDAETLNEMGPLLAFQAARMVQADVALVYLMDHNQQHLTPVGVSGLSTPIKHLEWSLENSVIGQTIRTGSLHYLPDSEPSPLSVRQGLPEDLRPAMCIPIRTTRGHVVGAILVARRKSHHDGLSDFNSQEQRLLKTLAEIAGNALLRARSHEELEAAYIETVLSLANAVDARDTYTNDHSQRLAILAEATAMELGCTRDEIKAVHWGALLHDIGKIGVPDDVLSKPGPLSDSEWDTMKKHPEIGAKIIAPLKRLTNVAPIIEAHQEKYDGTGYPRGLKGDQIPLPARILAVVDAYSAITDNRVYRQARSHEEAVAEIKRCSGKHFDPRVVEAFLRVLERPW